MSRLIDLTGNIFGKLKVIKRVENKEYKGGRTATAWLCKCGCGNEIICTSNYLKTNKKTSCGCATIRPPAKKKHEFYNTRIYNILSSMKQRCYNKNHVAYQQYGGRGITICEEWMADCGIIAFNEWAISHGYNDNLSIDRIDNNKGYSPDNCRWATHLEQQTNRRKTIYITLNETTKTVSEWSEYLGISREIIYERLHKKLMPEEILKPPRLWKSEKQSGIKGIIWQKHGKNWVVKGTKNGKPDCYLSEFKSLEDAIKFKKEYDENILK